MKDKKMLIEKINMIDKLVFYVILVSVLQFILLIVFINEVSITKEKILQDNINLMQQAGEEYILYNLSISPDENIFLTLDELYNKNLLLKLKDQKGEYCIENISYIKAEKVNDYYEMTTVLVCGNEVDTLIKYIKK